MGAAAAAPAEELTRPPAVVVAAAGLELEATAWLSTLAPGRARALVVQAVQPGEVLLALAGQPLRLHVPAAYGSRLARRIPSRFETAPEASAVFRLEALTPEGQPTAARVNYQLSERLGSNLRTLAHVLDIVDASAFDLVGDRQESTRPADVAIDLDDLDYLSAASRPHLGQIHPDGVADFSIDDLVSVAAVTANHRDISDVCVPAVIREATALHEIVAQQSTRRAELVRDFLGTLEKDTAAGNKLLTTHSADNIIQVKVDREFQKADLILDVGLQYITRRAGALGLQPDWPVTFTLTFSEEQFAATTWRELLNLSLEHNEEAGYFPGILVHQPGAASTTPCAYGFHLLQVTAQNHLSDILKEKCEYDADSQLPYGHLFLSLIQKIRERIIHLTKTCLTCGADVQEGLGPLLAEGFQLCNRKECELEFNCVCQDHPLQAPNEALVSSSEADWLDGLSSKHFPRWSSYWLSGSTSLLLLDTVKAVNQSEDVVAFILDLAQAAAESPKAVTLFQSFPLSLIDRGQALSFDPPAPVSATTTTTYSDAASVMKADQPGESLAPIATRCLPKSNYFPASGKGKQVACSPLALEALASPSTSYSQWSISGSMSGASPWSMATTSPWSSVPSSPASPSGCAAVFADTEAQQTGVLHSEAQTADWEAIRVVRALLERVPPLPVLLTCRNDKELRGFLLGNVREDDMEQVQGQLLPANLLQYLFDLRFYFRRLTAAERLPIQGSLLQVALVNKDLEEELANFKLRQEKATEFAILTLPLHKWHSVLRAEHRGIANLLDKDGTDSFHFAKNISTAMAYARLQHWWHVQEPFLMGVIEVLKDRETSSQQPPEQLDLMEGTPQATSSGLFLRVSGTSSVQIRYLIALHPHVYEAKQDSQVALHWGSHLNGLLKARLMPSREVAVSSCSSEQPSSREGSFDRPPRGPRRPSVGPSPLASPQAHEGLLFTWGKALLSKYRGDSSKYNRQQPFGCSKEPKLQAHR
eukprot:SM000162S02380  [mRNA]  locus=s162:263902:271484:+ [translate_table: standard]